MKNSSARKLRIGMLGSCLLIFSIVSSISLGFSTFLIGQSHTDAGPVTVNVGEVVTAFEVIPNNDSNFSLCVDGFIADSQIFQERTIGFTVVCSPILRDDNFLTNGFLQVNLELKEIGGNIISSSEIAFELFVDGTSYVTSEMRGSSLYVNDVNFDINNRLKFEILFRLTIPDLVSYQKNFQEKLEGISDFVLGIEAIDK